MADKIFLWLIVKCEGENSFECHIQLMLFTAGAH